MRRIMSMQQYCLRWNNHQPNFISVFSNLLNSESLVDVTLSAEGQHLQAHKLVLSACSSYFQSLFTINPCQHPIVILKDVKFLDLKVIIDFMYYGEVNVSQDQLPHILKTAEMLKIKGLAEMPVEASVNKQNSTTEKAELLPPTDSNWSGSESHHRLTSSPSPLSPGVKRKRLRKSSTGSTERTNEEHPPNEVTLTSPIGSEVIKPEPVSFEMTSTPPQRKTSIDPELCRGNSHESIESESPHQITLQIPQQDMSLQHNVDSTPLDITTQSSSSSQSVSDRVIITTRAQYSQESQMQQQQQSAGLLGVIGPKRGRFLMRQSRVKRDNESNPDGSSDNASGHYLSVPYLRVERQVSDPLPTTSRSPPPSSSGLLTVPGTNILVKQHSHPLLPSQVCPSPPPPSVSMTPLQVPPPPHPSLFVDSDRSSSPAVQNPESNTIAETSSSASITGTLRVRTDELKRSVSSPAQVSKNNRIGSDHNKRRLQQNRKKPFLLQTSSTRSSHCPVVRPGPALGCNFCWNTMDAHGRTLRRKTKYHCPECQTNLCIVPCFQEYHERNRTAADPQMVLTASVMRMFPKGNSL